MDKQLQEELEFFADIKRNTIAELMKRKDSGTERVVGTFCQYAPAEIIYGAGLQNVILCGFNYDPIPLAETELPTNLCPLIKSSYGNILGQTCPFAFFSDLIVGETTCDGKKKMYEMLAELKPMHVIHLPNNPDHQRSLDAWEEELRYFCRILEDTFSVTITEEALRQAIHIGNQERQLSVALYELGKLDPPAITGLDMRMVMTNNYFFLDKEEKLARNRRLIDLCQKAWQQDAGPYPRTHHPKRIVVSGAGIDGVIDKTLKVIEELGAAIVCYEGCCGVMAMRRLIEESPDRDPIREIAAKYLDVPCAVMSPNRRRFEMLPEILKEWRADGLIHITVQACNPFAIESRQVEEVCGQCNVPYLHLPTDYSPGDEGQLRTRIEAFLEMLG